MVELPENNAELLLEHVEEEMVWTDSDEDEENMLDINELSALNKVNLLIMFFEFGLNLIHNVSFDILTYFNRKKDISTNKK